MGRIRSALLLCTPIPAVLLGVAVMRAHSVSAAVRLPQLGATLVALAIGGVVSRLPRSRALSSAIAVLGLAALSLTLVSPGLENVHRWVRLGPLSVELSPIVAPFVLWAAAQLRALRAVSLLGALQLVHLLQPDAGQATAFGLGAVVLLGFMPLERRVRLGAVALMGALTLLTWLRPDPLLPVPHVEEILRLASELGMGWYLAGVAALALPLLASCALMTEAWRRCDSASRASAAGILVYLTAQFCVPALRPFPVPLMGFSVSMLLGTWSALGLLVRETSTQSS